MTVNSIIMNAINPEFVYNRALDNTGLNWETAKFRLYVLNKAPKGDANRLDGTFTNGTTYINREAIQQYKTIAPHGLLGEEFVVLSSMKASGNRFYNPGTDYPYGDIVQPNAVAGRPANDWLHRVVKTDGSGGANTTPLWAPNPGGFATNSGDNGPTFRNIGLRKHEWITNGFYWLDGDNLLPLLSGASYADVGNLKFTVRAYGGGGQYSNVSWVADEAGRFGYMYPMHRYLADWGPESSIIYQTNPLTNKVIRTNGVLDALDTIVDLGTNSSKDIILLLVRTAESDLDDDLPLAEQEVIALWTHGRNIGNLYSSESFTGQALISIGNFLQFARPMNITESVSSEGL
jgi:hypothetical protein